MCGSFVRGIVVKDGKFLMIKELKKGQLRWIFPGGKVEQDEQVEAALIREMKEELGVNCLKFELIYSGMFSFYDIAWHGYYFLCSVDSYDFSFEQYTKDFGFFDISDMHSLQTDIPQDLRDEIINGVMQAI